MNRVFVICLFCWQFACTEHKENITFMDVLSGENSSEPNLHLSESGDVYLNWLETNGNQSALFFSTLEKDAWSPPNEILKGQDWFVNWADFPGITSFGTDNIVTHILDKSAPDTYAYDVKLVISNDRGTSWSAPIPAHNDGTHTEHGFVSKVALSKDTFMAVWLDGRQHHFAELDSTLTAQMTLRSAIFDSKGNIISEHEIDNRVCDCCQTDLAMTPEGPMVVYRNRSEDELRDTFYAVFKDTIWSEPKPVFNDNWKIEGCPVNGPVISVNDNVAVVSWFTIANDVPQVKLAFSSDYGDSFNDPITIDDSEPLGRLDVEMIDQDTALACWMDSVEGKTIIKLQKIGLYGVTSKPVIVTESSESRSSGFPRMIVKDQFAYLAWTEVGEELHIRTAKVNIEKL